MKRCPEHGSVIDPATGNCATLDVLLAVGAERERQYRLHGINLENESGTGPDAAWAAPLAGVTGGGGNLLEKVLRRAYNKKPQVTWLDILLEEFSEVAKETDPEKLADELVQVAAVAVSWAEKLGDPESTVFKTSSAETYLPSTVGAP